MRPRAFVVNSPHRADGSPVANFAPAEFFGTVEIILNSTKPPPNPMDSVAAIEAALSGYTKDDFIVLVGEMDLVAIMVAFAMQVTGGKINFLKWDRVHRAYFPYSVNLPQLFEEN